MGVNLKQHTSNLVSLRSTHLFNASRSNSIAQLSSLDGLVDFGKLLFLGLVEEYCRVKKTCYQIHHLLKLKQIYKANCLLKNCQLQIILSTTSSVLNL